MAISNNIINPFIGFAGNIGSGKTTLTKIISLRQKWQPFYESVSDNPYLTDFYKDMPRWGFNLQIFFLHKRFVMHQQISKEKKGSVQDRTIYEDVEIFAKNLYKMGHMTKRDWENYSGLFSTMSSYLKRPDLIIYLKASTKTLLSRIKTRNRVFEKDINSEYLNILNSAYDRWIEKENRFPVLIIDTDKFNIYKDHNKLMEIENNILKTL